MRPFPLGAAVALLLMLALAPSSRGAAESMRLADAASSSRAGAAVHRALERRERVPVVVALRASGLPGVARIGKRRLTVSQAQRRVLRRLPAGSFRVTARWDVTPGFAGTVTRAGLRRLLRDPDVARVDVDGRVRAALGQSVPLIRADEAQTAGATGEGVTVAVLDTGIDSDHPDLASALAGEQCFAHRANGDGGCPNGQPVQSGAGSAEDDEGHGTAVSGIITSGGTVAAKGVAPDAKIVAVKVLASDGGGRTADVVSGLDWVVNNRPDVKIVNLSLGGDQLFAGACDEANAVTIMQASILRALRSRGVTVFVASGNDGSPTMVGQPACVDSVLSVGAVYDADIGGLNFGNCGDATTAPDKVICASNGGSQLDLLAPGGRISAPARFDTEAPTFGTSAAAPHAAGVAALMLDVRPDLSPDQIEATLKATGVPTVDGRSGTSFPRVDALAALAAVAALPPGAPPGPYLPAAGATFTDPVDSAQGPDIGSVSVATSADGLLTFSLELRNRVALGGGESVWLLLDLDRNQATGGAGAEYALITLPDGTTDLDRWAGSWQNVRTLAETSRSGTTVSFRISQDELGARADFSFAVVAQTATAVADVAPNGGAWPFPAVPLVVEKVGTGAGTVAGGGVNGVLCGDVCSALFARSAAVALTAAPVVGSVFMGWEGGCAGAASCSVVAGETAPIRARFELLRRVSVATGGTGRGTVTSAPGGIACSASCSASFPHGTTVMLTPVPAAGSSFERWSDGCTGAEACPLAVDGEKSLTAVFADVAPPRAKASKSSGRRGRIAKLAYTLTDNTERVRLELDVVRGRKTVARIRRGVATGPRATVGWRVPKRFKGPARFCVRGRDAAGNLGNRSCAALRVTK